MLGTRIKMIRKELKYTQEKFAEIMFVTRSALANYETDRVIPSKLFIERLSSTFNVNSEWLKTGEGEMFNPLSADKRIARIIAEISVDQHPEEFKEAIEEMSKLDVEQIRPLLTIIREINKSNQK